MYRCIDGRALLMICFEHVEVGGVVPGMVRCHQTGSDVKSLSIQIRAAFDNGQDEWVIGHGDLDVVGLVDDSSRVGDREVNSAWPCVSYEPGRNNVWPVLGWGVIRRGGGSLTLAPDLVVLHEGSIGIAERGRLVVNSYGEVELGMGNRPKRRIWRIRS